ncbi:MAG TPA: LacI family DNA-binding transcriptional regulator [Tepidisphaeraceae bacterium]|jgi:LacI family transcriptional regulator|nr:LacI family DNA-binding transcriptional regulator [Tepidisphaeraceae bacterium]
MAARSSPSIYDLADTLGVSASTVSRVLNQRGGIGEATRKRVLASAKKSGFRPRMTARQLTVAIVIDRHRFTTFGGFVPNLLSCIIETISKHDVAVELVTEHNLDRLDARLIDGVVAMAWDDATIELLRGLRGVPVVTLNRMDESEFSSVASDHRQHGEMAADYFASRGHRRIAMICEERSNWGTLQRYEGFVSRLQELGLPVDSDTVSFTDHQPMYGLLRRLATVAKPTALFVANESMGMEAMYILQQVLQVRVPQDISLLGMESDRVSQFLAPPLTAIAQPMMELAERSLEVLLKQVSEKQGPSHVILSNRLIERESVASVTPPTTAVVSPSR